MWNSGIQSPAWNRRLQVFFSTGILLLAGDSLLNLAQVTRGTELSVVTFYWEALKWITAGALLLLVDGRFARGLFARRHDDKDTASNESDRAAKIDRLYAELRPLMSRAASDPAVKEQAQTKLSALRRLQSEEADEMEKRFEASLLLKPGEGWQALKRADELLARYENPAIPDAPTKPDN